MTQDFDHRILDEHAFGIVAPTAVADLPPGIAARALVPSELAASAHLMPRLIDLRTLPPESAQALLMQMYQAHMSCLEPPVPLLVKTDADADKFARHWNAQQLVSPQTGVKSWLRLHDPRVMHQLLRMLAPRQRAPLFGPAHAIRYQVGGKWMTARPDDRYAHDSEPAFTQSAHDTGRWDWERVGRIGLINRVLHAAGVAGDALHTAGATVERLFAHATNRHGLTSASDLVEFATRGLTVGPTFDADPRIAAAIVADADGPDASSLADRLALIDDAVWAELRGNETRLEAA